MALSDLKVFSSYVQGSMIETLAEQVELFNAASNGALTLTSARNEGDYDDETYWKNLPGLVKNRNAYGTGAVAAVDLAQLSDTSVKVGASAGPVNIDPGMFRWIQKNPEEAGVVVGQQLAEQRLQNMVETGIGSFVAAIKQGVNYSDAKTASLSLSLLNKTASLLGDQSGNIAAWVMHSTPMHDLYGEGLANAERLFTYGTVNIVADFMGRPLIMSDNDSLFTVAGADVGIDSYNVCGIQSGGILCQDNGDMDSNTETSNGDVNILRTYQAEWSFNTGVKGFAWDKTNGGPSPTLSALTTSTNWDQQSTSSKSLAGVLAEVRAKSDVV